MWDEMDHYITFHPKCQEDIVAYARHVNEFRIYELLVGVHSDFEQVRVNFLGKDPLSSFNKVYAYLHREEKRHSAMTQSAPIERSVLVSSS